MPLAQSAPKFRAMFKEYLDAENTGRLLELMEQSGLDDSPYYHWDQLRHREPPAGLTHREWWFCLKSQRNSQRREVPLKMKDGSNFWFSMTDELHKLSDEITHRAGGSISDDNETLSSGGRADFVVRSLVEESVTSSQMEGASTSRRVAVELIDSGRKPIDKSEEMIFNNYIGMQYAKEHRQQPLTTDLVLELHRILTLNTLDDAQDAGRLETEDHERVKVWDNDRLVHWPPPAEELPERLEKLCAFANDEIEGSPYMTPVVRAIILHFMFGYDHYFADGNGRTARTAFYWSMLRRGYRLAEYVTISKFLALAPSQYMTSYEYTEDDDGDLTYFILHQLKTIRRGLDELEEYIAYKVREQNKINKVLNEAVDEFNHRQLLIIDTLVKDASTTLTAPEVARRYRVTTQTARADLKHLASFELVKPGRKKNPQTWRPVRDLTERLTKLGSS